MSRATTLQDNWVLLQMTATARTFRKSLKITLWVLPQDPEHSCFITLFQAVMSKVIKIMSGSCFYYMEMSCVASTGGKISSAAKPDRFCRTPNSHPQPSPVTDWTLEIMPCPMYHATGSHENPLTTTASFSFLVSWRVHQQWWTGWAELVKGHSGCQRASLTLLK